MRVKGTHQLGYSDGLNLNQLGYFPEFRAKEFYTYPRYYYFDFGVSGVAGDSYITSSPDVNNNYWNNLTGITPPGIGQRILNNVRTSKNFATTISLSGLGGYNSNANFLGGQFDPGVVLLGDFAIPNATKDYFYNGESTNVDFLISNLSQDKIYDFAFFGSRNTTQTRVTAYFVSGSGDLQSGQAQTSGPGASISNPLYFGNDSRIVRISGVKPNPNNQIRFYLNTVSGSFQHLNVMKMTERSDKYNLVWEDDFNGTTLNTNNWYAVDNYDGANGTLQFFTSRTGETGNLNISGSILYLTARSGEYTSQGPWMPTPATTQFTSALIESLGKQEFQYGKVEAKMKLPSGQGLWPAFWMLGINYFSPGIGWPRCGEIDIMEHANIQPNYTAALHTLNRNHTISAGGWVQGISTNNYHTQFNIYGAEWTPEKISFYFNDNIFYTVTKKQAGGGVGSFSFIDPVPADGNYFIYQDGVDYGGRFTLNGGVATITNPGCNYDSTRYVSGAVPNGARMTITNSVSCNTSDTHWPFDQKFWLKLNLSVGGAYGGNPNGGDWSIPHTMEVDWVKVYQKQ